MSQYDMNVHDYFRIVRKRKWIIIFTTLAVYIAAIVYTKMQVKLYRSIARVSVISKVAGNDPLGLKKNEYTTEPSKNLDAASEIIKSREVALLVINELGLVEKDASMTEVNDIIDKLKGRIEIGVNKTSGLITLGIVSGEPKKATKIVNALAKAFRIESIKRSQYQDQNLLEYLNEKFYIAKNRLKESENNLLNFKKIHSLELLNPQLLTQGNISNIEVELSEIIKKRSYFEEQLNLINQKSRGKNIDISKITILNDDAELKKINDEVSNVSLKLTELNEKFMPTHPKIFILKESVTKLKEKFEIEFERKSSNIKEKLNEEINSLLKKESELKDKIETYKAKMINFPKVELDLKRYQRTFDINEKMYLVLRKTILDTNLRKAREIGDIIKINAAAVPTKPFYPNERQSALAGLVIGLILGFAFAFIVESMDTSIGTIEDVEKYIQKTVLGVIPHIKVDSEKIRKLRKRIEDTGEVFNERQARLVSICDPKSPVTEAYRTLRTNLQFALPNKTGCNTILLSSATPQEGKSTTLTNLSVILAQAGKKVLIMSCNLRHPSVYKIYGVKKKPGITDILAGTITWREALQDPGIDNLRILSAGPYPPNPSEILQSKEFDDLLKELKQEFDVILFDSPPILPVTDAAIVASKVDAVVLIYFVGKAAREALMRAKIQLENVNANIIGLVLNDIKAEGKLAYTYYYHYQYKYYGVRDASEV